MRVSVAGRSLYWPLPIRRCRVVSGRRCGEFAVIRQPFNGNVYPWSVTHLPTGMCAAESFTPSKAMAAARAFNRLPVDWRAFKFGRDAEFSDSLRDQIRAIRQEAKTP